MRLLNVHTLTFAEFDDRHRPQYVIASHRWCDREITFQDVQEQKNTQTAGYVKVQRFADFVKHRIPSIHWLWIDTCCIDKKDAVERDNAINSMFHWYRGAEMCLALLSDVATIVEGSQSNVFTDSVWFTRGWTLQELLAPCIVVFLSNQWQIIGYKGDSALHRRLSVNLELGKCLNTSISALTGVPNDVLCDYGKHADISDEEKWGWAEGRQTTRPEDMTYCLLGIFDVSMNIRYGGDETGFKTRQRLEAKIKKARQPPRRSTVAMNELNMQEMLEMALTQITANLSVQDQHHLSRSLLRSPRTSPAITTVLGTGLVRDANHIDRLRDAPKSVGRRKSGTRVARLTLRLPWLTTLVWDFILLHAIAGWNVLFRTYNEVPYHSDILDLCRCGDLLGMQGLVSNGLASWLDRAGPFNLLVVAKQYGHLELCRYLLEKVNWLDQEDIIWDALATLPFPDAPTQSSGRLFELLLQNTESEIEVSEDLIPWFQVNIWSLCPTVEAHKLMMDRLSIPWSDLSRGSRLDLAIRRSFELAPTPEYLLRDLDLQADSIEWVTLRDRAGESVLHAIAWSLCCALCGPCRAGRSGIKQVPCGLDSAGIIKAWLQFGVQVLRIGVDPHIQAKPKYPSTTPLLGACHWIYAHHRRDIGPLSPKGGRTDLKNGLLEFLSLWVSMIRDAGLDPHTYCIRESEILKAVRLTFTINGEVLRPVAITYDEMTSRCDFGFERSIHVELYKRNDWPGGFPLQYDLQTICWFPVSKRESQEGHWTLVDRVELRSKEVISLREGHRHEEPKRFVERQQQDDADDIFLLHTRTRKARVSRTSHSLPPPLGRQPERKFAWRTTSSRYWLPDKHLCPRDQRARYCYWRYSPDVAASENIRQCVQATSAFDDPIQGTDHWYDYSFLAEIDRCQRGRSSRVLHPMLSHTGTTDCPQRCELVKLQSLEVPQLLRFWHPY